MLAAETHLPWKHKQIIEQNKVKDEEFMSSMEEKKGMQKFWPIITSGAGLFSDGYVNNVSYQTSPLFFKVYSFGAVRFFFLTRSF